MRTPWSRVAVVSVLSFVAYGCSDSAEEAPGGGGPSKGEAGSKAAGGKSGSAGSSGSSGRGGTSAGGAGGGVAGASGSAGGGATGAAAGIGGSNTGGASAGASGSAGSGGATVGGNGGGKSGGAAGASAGAAGIAGSGGSNAGAAGSSGSSAGTAGKGGSAGGSAGAAGSVTVDDSANPKKVRTVYIVPSDKTPNPKYAQAIGAALRHLQIFYRNELGNGQSFSVYDPIVETLQTKHSTSYYATHDGGGDAKQRHYDNVADDGFAHTNGKYNDPNFRYVFYVDSDPPCGQLQGAGGDGVTVLPANDLRGLVGEKQVAICPNDPDYGFGVCRWVGGLGHELGHALGLPHPPGCDAGSADCDSNDLMWLGYSTYPKTYIRDSEQKLLKASPFFKVITAPATLPSCETLL